MKPELRTKWVDALRSGDYQQTQGALRKKNSEYSYCCLGVLCQIIGVKWENEQHCYYQIEEDKIFNGGDLNIDMCDDIGLSHTTMGELAMMNDGRMSHGPNTPEIEQHSFEKIADYIEKNEV